MPDNYNMTHTGQQLDAAVEFGMSPDSTPTQNSNKGVKSGGVYTALAGKQNTLTFDNAPTQNSNNPVKSGGVYTALAGKQNALTFDNSPTSGSNNPVKSGGIYTALQGKQDTLTIDSVPTNGSNNPVASNGVYDAIRDITKLDTEGLSLTRTANAIVNNTATKNIYKGDFFFLTEDQQTLCKAIRHIAAGTVLNRFNGSGTPNNYENYIVAKESSSSTTYFFDPITAARRAKKWSEGSTTRVFTMTEVGGASNVLITYGFIAPTGGGSTYVSYGVYLIFYTSYWTVVPIVESTNHPTVAMDSNHTLTVTYSNVDSAKFGECCLINLAAFPTDII